MTKVFVGMSGGVDSSLSAALLKEKGYDVTGVYMKNWTRNLPGFNCPWAKDLADAKRVAVQLGIDFKVFDFENQYKELVVDYMINEYKAGRTPNPDIMCNQEVKFKLFLEAANKSGADMIAMGHYARTELTSDKKSGLLKMAVDSNKDQTYFLYRVTGQALKKVIFPIGEYTKPIVRQMAKDRKLYTADKRDSQGICFIGEIGIKDFLANYVKTEPGKIIDCNTKKVVGYHDGAIYYTIGQRHGLSLGGGLPYYVVGKDVEKNEVYVSKDLNSKLLWIKKIRLTNLHWINDSPLNNHKYYVRIRHRAPLIEANLMIIDNDLIELELKSEERAVTPGQSTVVYDNDICLGGGIVI